MMKKIFYSVLMVLVLILSCPVPVRAQASNELLKSDEVIDSDFIRFGETVQIDGEIRGDAFLGGGMVTVNGKIDGDLFILGGKVNVNGEVGNSVRVLGGDVTINGPVGKNVLLLCANCSVTKRAVIFGSLLSSGANLDLSAGKIGRGLRFFGSRLYLNSEVGSDAFVVSDREFLLGPMASIAGSLKYSGQEVNQQNGSTVQGGIFFQKNATDESYPRFFGAKEILASYQKVKPITEGFGFIITALIGFVLLGLFPKTFEKVAMTIEKKPVACLGWGTIVALMLPVLALLFALTIVGIPVSLLLILLAYLVWVMAQYLTAFFLGRKILLPKFGERRGWAILLGLILITAVGMIPYLGNLVKLVLVLFSFGAAVLAYKQPPIFVSQLSLNLESSQTSLVKRGRGRPKKN